MLKYVLKRIISALVTIFFIITITFFLMKAIPGNPFAAEKMPNPEIEAAMMAKYGLDQPLWKQYTMQRMHGIPAKQEILPPKEPSESLSMAIRTDSSKYHFLFVYL